MNIQKTNFNEVNTPIDNKVRVVTYSRMSSPHTYINHQLSYLNEVVTSHSDWELLQAIQTNAFYPNPQKP